MSDDLWTGIAIGSWFNCLVVLAFKKYDSWKFQKYLDSLPEEAEE